MAHTHNSIETEVNFLSTHVYGANNNNNADFFNFNILYIFFLQIPQSTLFCANKP